MKGRKWRIMGRLLMANIWIMKEIMAMKVIIMPLWMGVLYEERRQRKNKDEKCGNESKIWRKKNNEEINKAHRQTWK